MKKNIELLEYEFRQDDTVCHVASSVVIDLDTCNTEADIIEVLIGYIGSQLVQDVIRQEVSAVKKSW